jgi:hypothetical protein
VGERSLHTREVAGSKPAAPIFSTSAHGGETMRIGTQSRWNDGRMSTRDSARLRTLCAWREWQTGSEPGSAGSKSALARAEKIAPHDSEQRQEHEQAGQVVSHQPILRYIARHSRAFRLAHPRAAFPAAPREGFPATCYSSRLARAGA